MSIRSGEEAGRRHSSHKALIIRGQDKSVRMYDYLRVRVVSRTAFRVREGDVMECDLHLVAAKINAELFTLEDHLVSAIYYRHVPSPNAAVAFRLENNPCGRLRVRIPPCEDSHYSRARRTYSQEL